MKIIFLIFFICLSTLSFSQEVFPEKYSGCALDYFAFEKDTTESKLDIKELLYVFKEKTGVKAYKRIRGVLSLQVIVDIYGNPCLMSIENKTNIKSTELPLKEIFDKSMVWSKPSQKVSALLILDFTDAGVGFRRVGRYGEGWQDLR